MCSVVGSFLVVSGSSSPLTLSIIDIEHVLPLLSVTIYESFT